MFSARRNTHVAVRNNVISSRRRITSRQPNISHSRQSHCQPVTTIRQQRPTTPCYHPILKQTFVQARTFTTIVGATTASNENYSQNGYHTIMAALAVVGTTTMMTQCEPLSTTDSNIKLQRQSSVHNSHAKGNLRDPMTSYAINAMLREMRTTDHITQVDRDGDGHHDHRNTNRTETNQRMRSSTEDQLPLSTLSEHEQQALLLQIVEQLQKQDEMATQNEEQEREKNNINQQENQKVSTEIPDSNLVLVADRSHHALKPESLPPNVEVSVQATSSNTSSSVSRVHHTSENHPIENHSNNDHHHDHSSNKENSNNNHGGSVNTAPDEVTIAEARIEEATRKAKQHAGGLKVFSGNGNMSLALEICRHLGVNLGKAIVGKFADGEVNIVIQENVRGKDVYVIQPTCPPVNDNIMELLLMVSTLRRSSARRITVVIPYYGYARQDRKMQVGRRRKTNTMWQTIRRSDSLFLTNMFVFIRHVFLFRPPMWRD
jgi:N-terminal domain of ribose phosphate pyrophosphokinase